MSMQSQRQHKEALIQLSLRQTRPALGCRKPLLILLFERAEQRLIRSQRGFGHALDVARTDTFDRHVHSAIRKVDSLSRHVRSSDIKP